MSGRLALTVSKVQMILATGNPAQRALKSTGFTLIEIILVLGLMVFALAVMITNFASTADRGDAQTTEEILFAAIRKARFIAASERTVTQLNFDKETGSLEISSNGSEIETLPLDESFKDTASAEIRFYLVPPSKGLAPASNATIRSSLKATAVRFAADRSSNPFIVEIDFGSGTPERLVVDPFSSLTLTQK